MIETGRMLGPYEILGALGAGGMGEVYKARDTRLNRIVALKVIAAHLVDSPQGRERLEREARAISGLNHPHICTLYDIGRTSASSVQAASTGSAQAPSTGPGDGLDYLVMEYLEGETLAARLGHGALPLEQALDLAIQIASALDAAHRHGIVHRDLKPANVMLTKAAAGGAPHAKLLDFGLAKLSAGPQAAGAASMLPTALPSADLTGQGTIVGTLQYMAPEQLEGEEADARTDIFAFGALLYEMVTGRKAFEGKSQASLISAIMTTDPPSMSVAQSMSPAALDHLVRRCLAKDPADRWQTMRDVMAQLKWIAEGGSQVGVPAPVAAARRTRGKLTLALLAGAAMVIVGMAAPTFLYFRGAPPPDLARFTIDVPLAQNPAQVAVSPDGRWIAFQSIKASGRSAISLRRLDSTEIEDLVGTEQASSPFWSPDSRYIGFFANGKLSKVAVIGGAPQILGDAPGSGATWSTDGTILFSTNTTGALYTIPAAGGTATPLEVDTGSPALFMQFLPDGRHYVYTAPNATPPGIYVASLDSRKASLLIPVVSSTTYVSPGYLLFQRQGTLFAQAFDSKALTTSGEPLHIADDIFFNPVGRAGVAASENGVLAYRESGGLTVDQQFTWFDRSGKALGLAGKAAAYSTNFDLSPDGSQVVLSIIDGGGAASKLWLMDWQRNVTQPFSFDTGSGGGRDVVWSPDGLQVAYSMINGPNNTPAILARKSSGLGEAQVLLEGPGNKFTEDWSKDGRYIVYGTPVTGGIDIWALPLFGDRPSTGSGRPEPAEGRKPFAVVESPFTKDEPHFSFDTKWLAYSSNESGVSQIYVVSFPARDQKRQISDGGGAQPRWNRSGTELYYLNLEGKMMAVNVTTGVKLTSGAPRQLFDAGLQVVPGRDQYAVTPDGQRFLILKPLASETRRALTVVLNWTRLLKP